ncbi:hypothetical protein N9B39_01585 [bacterium]|nr:hypothetical protein [Rubripirellula sp.]MDA7878220.1 hypothetical protein [bacterium]MDB4353461.1 hypothetical protein [bacterium]MDB4477232.1 hypothetical protein [Rhodopirellula sp.]MDB4621820.1 hypothetical protein [Rubripirellula sp.]
MNAVLARALIGIGLAMFVGGLLMRRFVPREDVPNVTYLGIYALAVLIMGVGYVIRKRSGL